MELLTWCVTLVVIVMIICYTAYRLQLLKDKAMWRDELAKLNRLVCSLGDSLNYIKCITLSPLERFPSMDDELQSLRKAVNAIAKDTYTLTHPNTNK